ncbi:hypothetical protein CMEL01_15414 [Colletotrichum melonis]|uniref:Uncharacterized protein n=2 Tax=Colletotrichum acutatum species complex TaxID=2707335 RepID=A0AAI9UGT0_9PEZI|nr:hypothetical protein CMEL01_15414 [Colletotrichum melonis]
MNNLVDGHSSHDKHGSAEMWHPTRSLTDFVDAVQSAHERLADRSTSGKQARMEGKSAAASALSAIPGLNSLLQPLKPSEGTKSHHFTGGNKGAFAKGGR